MRDNENERLVIFSDAVIGITITLLALDTRLPDVEWKFTDFCAV